jgi:ribosomal protein S18 acetylase RimI-like enzyme
MQLMTYSDCFPESIEAQVIATFIEAFASAPRFEPWCPADVRAYLQKRSGPGSVCVVAIEQDKLLGFGLGLPLGQAPEGAEIARHSRTEKGFYISSLAVNAGARGQGLGTRLTQALLVEAEPGYSACLARSRTDAGAVRRVFSRLGFSEAGRYLGTTRGVLAERIVHVKAFPSEP